MTFDLLKPGAACNTTTAADVVYTTTIANVASGDNSGATNGWSTADGDNTVHSYVVPRTVADQGVYTWRITYTGDSANLKSSNCTETADVEYGLS